MSFPLQQQEMKYNNIAEHSSPRAMKNLRQCKNLSANSSRPADRTLYQCTAKPPRLTIFQHFIFRLIQPLRRSTISHFNFHCSKLFSSSFILFCTRFGILLHMDLTGFK
ncbi:unnamed protein product, partial [Brenthis ino]